MNASSASLYVHIPFCQRKCLYCDFSSVEGTDGVEGYLVALGLEIARRAGYGKAAIFKTVYLGGGTPSLLRPRQIERILTELHSRFRVAPDAEVTLEANPGTVTLETLGAYRAVGISRLSIGVQSFDDRELCAIGRIHDRAEALRCVELARTAGFKNLGIDLIYSIPGQTLEQWEQNLAVALRLGPPHISAYCLTLETGTPLAGLARAGRVRMNSAGVEADMYRLAMERLGAGGYAHYEVSNYALPGRQCRHNETYWTHGNYLGLGPAAHSFWKEEDGRSGRRFWNVSDLSLYQERLAGGRLAVASEERIGPGQMLDERIFLGLRSRGLDLPSLRADGGYDLESKRGDLLQCLIAEGWLRLTPRGFPVCDEICARLVPGE
jgi:oxygen-independent coproporphyrinogen-3 oxidase